MDLSKKAAGLLSPGQESVCDLLAKLLAAAKRGELDAIAIVACGADGSLQTDFKGSVGFECPLNMGLDHVKVGVRMSFLNSQTPQPQILRPEGIKLS